VCCIPGVGDPQVHDHVLVANVVHMRDARSGWKGLYTALLRDHLHAATAVGRMAGAAKAAELGYGIEPDPGPSGRLGGWAIAGIPTEVRDRSSDQRAIRYARLSRKSSTLSPAPRLAGCGVGRDLEQLTADGCLRSCHRKSGTVSRVRVPRAWRTLSASSSVTEGR
jgi:hypothetical protein